MERPQETPLFKHAGKRTDGVIIDHALLLAAENYARQERQPVIVPIDGAPYRLTGLPGDALDTRYLIPHYERQDSREVHKEKMLQRMAGRFFGIARKNISVPRTCNEIDRELTEFIDAYATIQRTAEFSLSVPYGDMTLKERMLVERGSILAGHIVNRLARTGHVILNDGDTQGQNTLENIQELILRWSDKPQDDLEKLTQMKKPARDALRRELAINDFTYWVDMLTRGYMPGKEPVFRYKNAQGEMQTFSNQELMRCVITHNGLRDHDGALGYLVYEMRKIMTDELAISKREHLAEADPQHYAPYKRKQEMALHEMTEKITTDGIVTNIGLTCAAIDETYAALRDVVDNRRFRHFIDRVKPQRIDIDEERHDVSHYRGLLRDYTDAARKRCSINSRDALNFDPVALECTHLGDELRWLHDAMRAALDKTPADEFGPNGKLPIRNALNLLERGITLIDSMAEERIPRNASAPEVYDKNLVAYRGRDASSVGRLKEKIDAWTAEPPDLGTRRR